MTDWVEEWKIAANQNFIPDWNSFQIHVPTIMIFRQYIQARELNFLF